MEVYKVSEPKKTITLFYGGVVNLGRNMNQLSKELEPFVGIKEFPRNARTDKCFDKSRHKYCSYGE